MSTENSVKDSIITQAKINSTYYLNDKISYSTIDDAWLSLVDYVAQTSAAIVSQYGSDVETISVDTLNKRIIIKRKKHNVPLDSYIPIKDPVILDPLSANIKDK